MQGIWHRCHASQGVSLKELARPTDASARLSHNSREPRFETVQRLPRHDCCASLADVLQLVCNQGTSARYGFTKIRRLVGAAQPVAVAGLEPRRLALCATAQQAQQLQPASFSCMRANLQMPLRAGYKRRQTSVQTP
jgi:hypothetical protein